MARTWKARKQKAVAAAGPKARKYRDSASVTLKPVITTTPDVADRFKKWLSQVQSASLIGHSANFAMFVDGDGDEPFYVDEVELPKMSYQKGAVEYNVPSERVKESTSFSVFKDTAGNYRWILQSSNAFRDRDGEIVSTKALEDDVERTEKSGEYGPLRWWHVSEPQPLDIGVCDWRVVHGRTMIESGTFKTEAIGKAMKEAAPHLQVSIGFNHPADQPDPNGVFSTIRVFERSLLPAGKAANPFTRVFVKGDEMATKAEKLAALKALGVDPDEILSGAEETEKELDNQRVAFKEGEAEKAKKPMPDPKEEEDMEEEDLEEEEEDKEGDDEPVVGNMSVKEYAEMLTKALAPLATQAHSHEKEAAENAARAEKEAAERTALKEAIARQEQTLTATQQALDATAKALKETQARLAELEGAAPRVVKGYRASEDPGTVIDEAGLNKLKEANQLPVADPAVADFLGGFLGLK